MIDWPQLFSNALWILALSAALAVVSTASWQASLEGVKTRLVLARRGYTLALLGCLVLFGVGLTLSVQPLWEKLAWAALTVLSMVQFGLSWKRS